MSENITHIYDSGVPQPYKGYVEERSEKIGEVLLGFMPNQHIVICSRHVTPQELPSDTSALIYGVVVDDLSLGHKDTLYRLNRKGTKDITGSGIATDCVPCLKAYCESKLDLGISVRVKDSAASDSNGQIVVSRIEDFYTAVETLGLKNKLVAMPNLTVINDRLSIGVINLGKTGTFAYLGRENTTIHNGRECYGGTEIALFRDDDKFAQDHALKSLQIDPRSASMGKEALKRYGKLATVLVVGRASVDYIDGETENGDPIEGVIDLTARPGGVSPAEVLAIEALDSGARVAFAQSVLTYNPPRNRQSGTIFVDSKELRITAEVTGTL